MNPLLSYAQQPEATQFIPPFSQVTANHVVAAMKTLIGDVERGRKALEDTLTRAAVPSYEAVVDAFTDLLEPLERGWGLVTHLNAVRNSDALRLAHQAVQPDVVKLSLELAQSEPLYRALVALKNSAGFAALPQSRQRIVSKKILEAELSGIALVGEARARFLAIEQELSETATRFSNNVLDATKAFALVLERPEDVVGLPASARAQAAAAAKAAGAKDATAERGPWRITLDFPSFDPFLRFAERRELREKVYRAYLARASELEAGAPFNNGPLIERLLVLRQEKAALLGYPSYAALSLATKMAPSLDAVLALLEDLRKVSRPKAVLELQALEPLATAHGIATMAHWDVPFLAERLREREFAFSEEELRPYFSLPRVLDGLFALTTKLFGVTVVEATSTVARWHDDVRYFRITDSAGHDVAAFFLDPYARPQEKRGGAWMDDCVTRRVHAGTARLPVAYLVCNQAPPVDGKPALMTFRDVETLFHEFGHGLQHMLTRVDDVDASGIRGVEWDAVELPSQFMENWCTHKQTLQGLAKHVDTGAPLPDDLFNKLLAAKTFRAASMMLRQVAFARIDLELHSMQKRSESVFETQRRLAVDTAVMPPMADDRFLCSFSHIFAGGYSAGYYSYKWAEVLSADAFGAFEEAGLDDAQALAATGARFLQTVLALGGSVHPRDVFRMFRGRDPSTEALLRHTGLVQKQAA